MKVFLTMKNKRCNLFEKSEFTDVVRALSSLDGECLQQFITDICAYNNNKVNVTQLAQFCSV